MKVLAWFILQLSLAFSGFGQNLSGNWEWAQNPSDRSFSIQLIQSSSKAFDLEGSHCGTYYNGGRIDCAEELSIFLNQESENLWIGTIQSAYSGKKSQLTIAYNPKEKQLEWQITKGEGQFYFPYHAILEKVDPN
ncbi:hypothetical protein [Algoriphagus machipongonensis]|nr:hypothetical protein [Algoriphagus machipongonensis]